jgi:hypothetical protein
MDHAFYLGKDGTIWEARHPPPSTPLPLTTIERLDASPDNGYIYVGQSATITWEVRDCGQPCRVGISGRDYQGPVMMANVAPTGSLGVSPTRETQTTYTLHAEGPHGAASKDIVISLYAPPTPLPQATSYYFKLTQNSSINGLTCYTVAVFAQSQAQALELVQRGYGGFTVESITSDQFIGACPAPF